MERSEVLIVEAKQYATDGLRVVVPSLFGYTEQARRIKKTVTVSPPGVKWNKDKFIKAIDKANMSLRSSRTRDLFQLAAGQLAYNGLSIYLSPVCVGLVSVCVGFVRILCRFYFC